MAEPKTPWNPSRSAIKRVLNPLPTPKSCPFCHSKVEIASHQEVYGKTYSEWPWVYLCQNPTCKAYVGMHPYTNIPLGTLADQKTRDARKSAKDLFQRLWRNGGTRSRDESYGWLASKLDIPIAACHFGWFSIETCQRAKAILEKELQITPTPQKSREEMVRDF